MGTSVTVPDLRNGGFATGTLLPGSAVYLHEAVLFFLEHPITDDLLEFHDTFFEHFLNRFLQILRFLECQCCGDLERGQAAIEQDFIRIGIPESRDESLINEKAFELHSLGLEVFKETLCREILVKRLKAHSTEKGNRV